MPDAEITEGGGLSALRRKIEGAGGIMGVDTEPVFKLWLTLPREKEVYFHEESINR